MSKGKGCTVFVGNIPYDANEDDLKGIFGRVGAVESLRLVYDKDSKQPKGYGFCDYADAETAASAVRNLNDAEFAGRKLRIDLSDQALRNREGGPGGIERPPDPPPRLALPAPGGGGGSFPAGPPSLDRGVPPPACALPPGTLPPFLAGDLVDSGPAPEQILAEVSPQTEIAQTVASMPQARLQLCLGTMQRLAIECPEDARALLQEHPELCYALLHAQLLLGLNIEPRIPPGGDEARRLKAQAASRAYIAPVNPAMVLPPGGAHGSMMHQQLMAMAGAFRGQQGFMGQVPAMPPAAVRPMSMMQQLVRPGGPYGLPPLPGAAAFIPAVPPPLAHTVPPAAVGLAPKSSAVVPPAPLPAAVRPPAAPGVVPALPSL